MSMKPSIFWLLIFIPITVILEHVGKLPPPVIFFSAALAIVPIAALIVQATEQLAHRTGDAVGGLLNATFGNAPELIIATVALRAGLLDMVRASLIGAILANLLLALGLSFFLGGLRYRDQKYNPLAARTYSSMMLIAVISLVVPSAFSRILTPEGTIRQEQLLNIGIAVVLLLAYGLYLLFSLKTHPAAFASVDTGDEAHHEGKQWSMARAVGSLIGASVLAAWMSEILVGAAEGTGKSLGMSQTFHRHRLPRHRRRCGGERFGHCDGAQEQSGFIRGHCVGEQHPDCTFRRASACVAQLLHRASTARTLLQPRRDRFPIHGRADRHSGLRRWAVQLVQGRSTCYGVHDHRADVLLHTGDWALNIESGSAHG